MPPLVWGFASKDVAHANTKNRILAPRTLAKLVLENRGLGKPRIGIEFGNSTPKFERLKDLVFHKKTNHLAAIRDKAEELAELLCVTNDAEKEVVVRDVLEVLWRMTAWR